MERDLTRTLVESTVRRTLKNIQESPERAIRNFIDLGLEFSNGRFQTRLMKITQEMLHNQNSAYYTLVKNLAASVDPEIITTFGVNLGYDGCTKGAKTIREMESKRHFNIPWSLSLLINADKLETEPDFYPSLLQQGVSLGIHTYLLFVLNHPEKVIPFLRERQDCAFILFLHGSQMKGSFLREMDGVHNAMISVYVDQDMPEACQALRDSRMLYAVHQRYTEADKEQILSGKWLTLVLPHRPTVAILRADPACSSETQEKIYDYIVSVRDGQQYPVLFMDTKQDILKIDRIISDGECLVGFNADGTTRTHEGNRCEDSCNIFHHSLEEILQAATPKV